MQETETQIWSLGWMDLLWKEMATHSSILAWRIPWTEESGGLQSIAPQSWTQLKWLRMSTHTWGNLWCSSPCSRRITATAAAKSLQSCPTLCDPIDSSPLGSSVPGRITISSQIRSGAFNTTSLKICPCLFLTVQKSSQMSRLHWTDPRGDL